MAGRASGPASGNGMCRINGHETTMRETDHYYAAFIAYMLLYRVSGR